MAPGAKNEEVLMALVVRLKPGVLLLRAPHVFLIVVAADGKSGHGGGREAVLDPSRGPDAVISGMIEKEAPGRQNFGAGSLHVLGKGTAFKKKVEAVSGLAVLVLAIVNGGVFLAGFHAVDIVVAVTQPEGAIVKEIVAHPNIDHRRLGGDGLHPWVGIDAGHHGQKSGIAGADEAGAPVVAGDIRE